MHALRGFLYDLLGLQFSPRLRDLGDQKLYRIDTSIRYQNIGRLVRGTLKPRLILGHWDDMLRVAGSLKLGWVTASLFIAKLQGKIRRHYDEGQLNQVSCLNLVTNAVVLWNTIYMSAVLDQLRSEGYNVDDSMWCICRRHATRTSTPMGNTALTSKGNSIAKAFAR